MFGEELLKKELEEDEMLIGEKLGDGVLVQLENLGE